MNQFNQTKEHIAPIFCWKLKLEVQCANTWPQWWLLEVLKGFFAHHLVYFQALVNCRSQFWISHTTLFTHSLQIGLQCPLGNPSAKHMPWWRQTSYGDSTGCHSQLSWSPVLVSWVLVVASNCFQHQLLETSSESIAFFSEISPKINMNEIMGVLSLDPTFTQV